MRFAYPTSPLPGCRKPGQEPCLCVGGSGVLVSSRSLLWGQSHAHLAGQRGAAGSFAQPIWMLQLLPLPSLQLSRGCAVGMAAWGTGPQWRSSAVWHYCLAPRQGEHLAQAQNVPRQDPGAASLLNIDGYCLHEGLGPPAPQIAFLAAGPAQVPFRSQHSSWVGQGAQQPGECSTARASAWGCPWAVPLLMYGVVQGGSRRGEEGGVGTPRVEV